MANILIVDDDRQIIEFLSEFLSSCGHSTLFLVEPEYLFQKLESIHIDLILLDIYMPRVDGITLLKRIKEHPVHGKIPVIMVTAHDDEKILSLCFESGAMDFISKPVKRLELRARVNTALKINKYMGELAEFNKGLEQRVRERTRDLKESEDRLQSILDNTMAVVYLKDLQDRYLLINRRFETLFHLDREEIKGKTDRDIFPLEMAETFQKNDKKVAEQGRPLEFEESVLHDDGIHTYISIKFPFFGASGKVHGVCGISTDITDRKKAEIEREEFSRKLVDSQEAERKRIAMELHDGLGQNLIAMRDIIKRYSSALPEQGKEAKELDLISSLVMESIEEAREISGNLRPPVLDQLGLELALESIIEKSARSSNIIISSSLKGLDGFFPKDMEINIYRIVQEGLANIIKHSKAKKACVEAKKNGKSIMIRISDNGKGFNMGKNSHDKGGGFGLQGMSERVKMLGGTLNIDSAPGQGTAIEIKAHGAAWAQTKEKQNPK